MTEISINTMKNNMKSELSTATQTKLSNEMSLDEVAQSWKNRFKARAEDTPSFMDKMETLSGLPLSQYQRPVNRPGVPPRPNRPIYNTQSRRSYTYSNINELKRRLGNIEA